MLTSVLGRSVMAERHGAAPGTVLALHGWGRTRSDFDGVLDGFDGLALDLPGFGTTAAPDDPWSTGEYAAALVPLLHEMDRPVVVGHSFGGRVAAHLGVQAPGLIRGIVFTGAPLLRAEPAKTRAPLAFRLAKRARKVGMLSEARLDAARERYGSADYRAATGVMRAVLVKAVSEDYSDQLRAIARESVPTRFVIGAGDTAAPVEMSCRAAALAGAPEPTVVEGSAHLIDAGLTTALRAAIEGLLAPVGS